MLFTDLSEHVQSEEFSDVDGHGSLQLQTFVSSVILVKIFSREVISYPNTREMHSVYTKFSMWNLTVSLSLTRFQPIR